MDLLNEDQLEKDITISEQEDPLMEDPTSSNWSKRCWCSLRIYTRRMHQARSFVPKKHYLYALILFNKHYVILRHIAGKWFRAFFFTVHANYIPP
ncbi:hypothetical protein BC937DRAFT_88297, partial [Endogone sp. FLAS-F59071]